MSDPFIPASHAPCEVTLTFPVYFDFPQDLEQQTKAPRPTPIGRTEAASSQKVGRAAGSDCADKRFLTSLSLSLSLHLALFPSPSDWKDVPPNFSHCCESSVEPSLSWPCQRVPRTWFLSSKDSRVDWGLKDTRCAREGQRVARGCDVSPAGLYPLSLTAESPTGSSKMTAACVCAGGASPAGWERSSVALSREGGL